MHEHRARMDRIYGEFAGRIALADDLEISAFKASVIENTHGVRVTSESDLAPVRCFEGPLAEPAAHRVGSRQECGQEHETRKEISPFHSSILFQSSGPLVSLAVRFVLRDSVSFLNAAYKLLFLASDCRPVIRGQLAPTLAGTTGELFPFSFDLVPVHLILRL